MASLGIKTLPEPILRKIAKPIDKLSEEDRRILRDMAETMYMAGGVGLAAPQVGICKRIIVIDVGSGLLKMVNPLILSRDGFDCCDEGCLSVPGMSVKVKRSSRIVVEFLDDEARLARISANGILARAIQHELDHLDGKLIVDYLGPIEKLFIRNGAKKRLTKQDGFDKI